MEDRTQLQIKSLLTAIQGKLDTDILAECFAEILINSSDFDEENIHIVPTDQFRRGYENDITGTHLGSALKLFTSRNSLLDYLPENFYLEPYDEAEPSNSYNRQDAKIQQREKVHRTLDGAKRFFKPLEVEYNKARICRELQEVKLLEKYDALLRKFWHSLPASTPAWDRFLRTLHLVSYVVGDKYKTQKLIEFVLDKPVELTEQVVTETTLPDNLKSVMGQLGLGYHFSVGNVLTSFTRILTVTIKDLDPTDFHDYFDRGSETGKLLREIEKYYFPLDVEVQFDFQIKEEYVAFSLGSEAGKSHAILGFSSKI